MELKNGTFYKIIAVSEDNFDKNTLLKSCF